MCSVGLMNWTFFGRIVGAFAHFTSEAKLLNQYDNVIKEQLDSGVVEVIDKHVEEVVPGTVHYIPHKEVLKEDRATTKLRVVYDASAKSYSEIAVLFLYNMNIM